MSTRTAIAALLVGAASAVAPAQTPASIAGIVRDDRGAPIANARVALFPLSGNSERSTLTTADGRYMIPAVATGRYVVAAAKSGYAGVMFGRLRPGGSGTPVPMAVGQSRRIDLVLPRAATIAGVVRDEFGQPVSGITVRAIPAPVREYGGVSAQTNSRGEYRIWNVPPGRHVVSASSTAIYAGVFAVTDAAGKERTFVFREGFYPDARRLADAAVVSVASAEQVAGYDIVLRSMPSGRISGSVINQLGVNLETGSVRVLDDALLFGRSEQDARAERQGQFDVDGVPAGRWTLAFQALGRDPRTPALSAPYWASAVVDVSAGETTRAQLDVMEGARIGGRLEFAGTPPPNQKDVWLRIETVDGPFGRSQRGGYGERREGASFSVSGVAPGTWSISVTAPSPWWLLSALVGDRDVLDAPLSVGPGESIDDVRAFVTNVESGIAGAVAAAADGAPRVDHEVIVFPIDSRYWLPNARRIRVVAPDVDGRFEVPRLPPGDYAVVANRRPEVDALRDPSTLAALAGAATRVTVQSGTMSRTTVVLR